MDFHLPSVHTDCAQLAKPPHKISSHSPSWMQATSHPLTPSTAIEGSWRPQHVENAKTANIDISCFENKGGLRSGWRS